MDGEASPALAFFIREGNTPTDVKRTWKVGYFPSHQADLGWEWGEGLEGRCHGVLEKKTCGSRGEFSSTMKGEVSLL